MGTLYIDQKDLRLETGAGRLLMRPSSGSPQSVPLSHLERVVIRGQVQLDTRVLGALASRGAGVLLLSGRRSERVAIVLGQLHADGRRRLTQYQACTDPGFRLRVARRLVEAKLLAQARTLRSLVSAGAERRKPLTDAIAGLERSAKAAQSANSMDQLRGLEGAAAARYFPVLGGAFPQSVAFEARSRRPPRDPGNALMSLTYTILHFEAVTIAYQAGLDPYLGFFHEPAYGRESLAADLIEPLRPAADRWIRRLFHERALRADHFRQDKGAWVLAKTGRKHFYPAYEQQARRWRRYLRLSSYRLVKDLAGFP